MSQQQTEFNTRQAEAIASSVMLPRLMSWGQYRQLRKMGFKIPRIKPRFKPKVLIKSELPAGWFMIPSEDPLRIEIIDDNATLRAVMYCNWSTLETKLDIIGEFTIPDSIPADFQ